MCFLEQFLFSRLKKYFVGTLFAIFMPPSPYTYYNRISFFLVEILQFRFTFCSNCVCAICIFLCNFSSLSFFVLALSLEYFIENIRALYFIQSQATLISENSWLFFSTPLTFRSSCEQKSHQSKAKNSFSKTPSLAYIPQVPVSVEKLLSGHMFSSFLFPLADTAKTSV